MELEENYPSLDWLRQEMELTASTYAIPKQVENTWKHSTLVWKFAKYLIDNAIHKGYKINRKFIKIACYGHDFGRMITGSLGTRELQPAIYHGYEGAKFFRSHNYEALARICERHIGGIGLPAEINKKYALAEIDTFPETISELIVGYSDLRTMGRLENDIYVPCNVPFEVGFNRFVVYHQGNARRLLELQLFIKELTGLRLDTDSLATKNTKNHKER